MIDNELEFDRLAEGGGKSFIKKRMMVGPALVLFFLHISVDFCGCTVPVLPVKELCN
jgi:hypothetical protein